MKKIRIMWISMVLAAVLCGCASVPEQNIQESTAAQDPVETSGGSNAAKQEAVSEESPGNEGVIQQKEKTLTDLADLWDFDSGAVFLEQVTEALDSKGIRYTGYYNVSGERLDVTLEDGTVLIFFEINDPEAEYWEHSQRYQLIMQGEDFNRFGFQENYLNEYGVTEEEEIWPSLSDPELDFEMLWRCNQTDLSIARNQVFARYGRKFTDSFLNAVFSQKTWYEPKYEGSDFDTGVQDMLTETEKTNLAAVLEREEELYYRKSGNYDTVKVLLSGSWLDVDGDGQQEQIFYRTESEEPDIGVGTAVLTIREENGREETVRREAYAPHKRAYVCSVAEGMVLLAIADNGLSADYTTEFYAYEEGGLTSLGTIDTFPRSLQLADNKISGLVETWHLQCEPIRFTYVLQGNKLEWQKEDYYEYRGNEAEALMMVKLYDAKGDTQSSTMLNIGDKVKVLGGDLSEWVKLEMLSDGRTYWLKVKEGMVYLSGEMTKTSSLVFDGLTFYG